MNVIFDELKDEDKNNRDSDYLRFGFPKLEEALRIHREEGQLVVLASRPAMGKTSLVINMVSAFAEIEDEPVAFFSIEMLSKDITLRLLEQKGNIESKCISNSKLCDGDRREISKTISDLAQLPVFLNDDAEIDLDKIKEKSLKVKEKNGLGLIVIDYLGLLNSTEKDLPRKQQIFEMMRGLKLLAKELKVPIIILSQLSRCVETRKNKRPRLSDLRKYGEIDYFADVVMFLYRDIVYNSDSITPDDGEVIIVKNRRGEIGTINLKWNSKNRSFSALKLNK